MVFFSHDHPV
ncbi:hypothetical protein BSP239C_03450 [Brevibacterium sp. 239c]|nr:hypothetical protein BSP239C_03450 [Brevibacterium sp. 239c]